MSKAQNTQPLAAAAMALAGMAVIGLIDNFVIIIAQDGGLWQFHAMRAAMVFVLLVALAYLGLGRLRPHRPVAVLARSILFSVSMLIYFGCLAFLPIAEVVAGLFSAPIFVLIISSVFLGKPVGVLRWGAAIVGFLGVLMVLRPEAGSITWVSVMPLVAAVFYAISVIATRAWCEGEDTLTLLIWFFSTLGVFGFIGMIALTIFPQAVPDGTDGFVLRGLVWPSSSFLFWTLIQAVFSVVAVGLLTKGYQVGEASFVAIFEYSLMIFAGIWAWVLRGEVQDILGLSGMALILASGAVIALRSRA